MRVLVSLFCGALFGLGLTVSGMTDTAKVQGWLDLFGAWDPTLAFVLGGAILPMLIAWRIAARREKPTFGDSFPDRPKDHLDGRLLGGSALFGLGWALVGLCPGPAMAVLGYGSWPAALFFVSMLVGMGIATVVPSAPKVPAA
jgi:uncharacterized membrane protein YedE/YeeE